MAQFVADNESSITDSESEEVNYPYYERASTWSKGPVTNNLSYPRDQTERQNHIQKKNGKRGKDDFPMDTSTTGNTGRVRVSVNSVLEFPGAGLGRLITINSELNGAI